MKRVGIIALFLLILFVLTGCESGKISSRTIADAEFDNKMFMIVSEEVYGYVIVEKSTRVMYWRSSGAYNGGTLTLLVNPDGTPMVWNG